LFRVLGFAQTADRSKEIETEPNKGSVADKEREEREREEHQKEVEGAIINIGDYCKRH